VDNNTINNEQQQQQGRHSYLNNSAFHHTLSIKQFLEAKEQLAKKKIVEEAQFKQRSQLYESIMKAEESNYNQQRSTSSLVNKNNNIPHPIAKLKINPGELFSACRNGRDCEISTKPKIPADTLSMIKLARSRSDVGHKPQVGPNYSPSTTSTHQPHQNQKFSTNKRSELEEVQLRIIRKSKPSTPLGDISTFLGKHIINQNSGCLNNEESDENPLSKERRRLLKHTRPRSAYQNLNDQSVAYYYPEEEEEDQENIMKEQDEDDDDNVENYCQHKQSTNPFFNNHEQDPGFKERCKFLEKSLYNSVS
jgi:hypothetical protein